MPEFYFVPKKLARRAPLLAKLSQKLEGWAFGAIFALMQKLSVENAIKLAGFAFWLPARFSDKADKARQNLAVAFPESTAEWREQTTREIFRSLGYSAAELIKLEDIWEQRDERLEFVIAPAARQHLESGGATIFITAHVGPWQVAPLILRPFGLKIHAIYAPESNPALASMMLGLRKSFGEGLIAADAGPRPIMKALKEGGSVIMAMDTRPDTGKMVPFFGQEALTNTSAVGLALRTGAALVVARGERLPGARFRITMYDPLVSPDPEAPVKEQSVVLTEMIHTHFEQWIREYPAQWVCLKRRWPKAHKL
ncbi:MAG: lysophospholipid acyltransferase family protein [Halioglobus sp.]|nr:lysophospholipid acyltransferase family protein [Halioglobus sp.]